MAVRASFPDFTYTEKLTEKMQDLEEKMRLKDGRLETAHRENEPISTGSATCHREEAQEIRIDPYPHRKQ